MEKVSYTADILYTYLIPKDLEDDVAVGKRVVVPFGGGNSLRRGIILETEEVAEKNNLKSITMILDATPCVSKEMINLIKWVKNHYFCTYFEALKLIIPAGINGDINKIKYKMLKPFSEYENILSDEEKKFISKINLNENTSVTLKEIKNLKIPNYNKILFSLVSKNIVKEKFDAFKTVGEKSTKVYSLSKKTDYKLLNLKENQKKVCEFLESNDQATTKEICYYTGVSISTVNTLLKKEILLQSVSVRYISPKNCISSGENTSKNELSVEQDEIFRKLLNSYNQGDFNVSLLHGVTGSGKTEIILKLTDKVIGSGKSVIYMLPEIALTGQVVENFKSRYKETLAVIHSGISDLDRFDAWKKIKSGEIKVVLGTRSAVFAPLENLGLIVVDEEHEFTYKSESSPRFSAQEVAKYRCKTSGGMLLLSSATPSFETYFMAVHGFYDLYTLENRYGDAVLPAVEIVDMNKENNHFEVNQISEKLLKELKNNFESGNQSIVFINRRGYNTFAKCAGCKEVLMCPNCSVSLNYHKANGKLMCHYCGYSADAVKKCPNCGEKKVYYTGVGTQKIEDTIGKLLPKAKILRIDSDSKSSDFSKLKKFSSGKYDILIGTQMISKGFNFPNVTLVGVISADSSLYGSDFRSYERSFSLFTQVIGRAGRGKNKGKAIIQTFSPENEILKFAANQDYCSCYLSEINMRKIMLYPPFSDICVIGFSGKKEEDVFYAGREFFKHLKTIASESYGNLPLRIFPPTPALVKKVSSKFRYKIIIKCKNNLNFREMISESLYFTAKWKFSGKVNVFADINPESIL